MLLLLPFLLCSHNYSYIANAINRLHTTTNYSTFYEMFGIPEHASLNTIKSAFRRLLPKTKDENLLFEAYNILSKDRRAHDHYLIESTFPQTTNSWYSYVLFSMFVIVCLDFGFMVYRIQTQKMTRKRKGKTTMSIKEMHLVKMTRWMKSKICG